MRGTPAEAGRLRELRQETLAAIEALTRLAHAVRGDLIRLVADGRICPDGATEALQQWGLEPMPQRWSVLAEGRLWYRHTGAADDDRFHGRVLAAAHRVLPTVTLLLGRADDPRDRTDRLALPFMLRIDVTTGFEHRVLAAAQQLVHDGLPALQDRGITLTGLTWKISGEPRDVDQADLPGYLDTLPADPPPVRPPDSSGDLPAAARERDAALRRLDVLRREVRERALRALLDDQLGADPQEAADILEPVLIRLGLGALPRAHQFAVVADLTLRVPADSADHAFATAYAIMQVFVERCDPAWRWQRSGSPAIASPPPAEGDHWLVPWRLEYTTSVRGHLDPAATTAAADAVLRAALTTALGAALHQLTVTATSRGFGIDPYANPRTD